MLYDAAVSLKKTQAQSRRAARGALAELRGVEALSQGAG